MAMGIDLELLNPVLLLLLLLVPIPMLIRLCLSC